MIAALSAKLDGSNQVSMSFVFNMDPAGLKKYLTLLGYSDIVIKKPTMKGFGGPHPRQLDLSFSI